MPQLRQPKRLKDICIANLVENVDKFWLAENSQERLQLEAFCANSRSRYLITPFSDLDSSTVDFILRSLYKAARLNRNHLLVFLQFRLRSIDLSFVKKKNLINSSLAYYIGRNCIVSVIIEYFLMRNRHTICENLFILCLFL